MLTNKAKVLYLFLGLSADPLVPVVKLENHVAHLLTVSRLQDQLVEKST